MRTDELEKEAKKALKTFPFLKKMELIDKLLISRLFKLLISDYFEPHENFQSILTGTD